MNFISIEFLLFLALLVLVLAFMRNQKAARFVLFTASVIFYAWWDWRLFFLMLAAALANHTLAGLIEKYSGTKKGKRILITGVVANILLLAVFKYADFFLDSFAGLTGTHLLNGTLRLIVPLGLSFITFENLGYLIDIYHQRVKRTSSLLDYANFMFFFPRVASGPIMRARIFLPQLEAGIKITPERVFLGAQLFLQGLIKKVVVADNAAILANQIFAAPSLHSPGTVWLGVFAFSIQIFHDFSGYTDMATGAAKMIGFDLPPNFNLPYTAQSITEFWQRWHISLSTWFRDYLFYPLERARKGKPKALSYLNLLTVMLICGLWHGAGWNFVIWGGLLGLYMVIERLFFDMHLQPLPWGSWKAWARAGIVFVILSLTWIPFRSPDWDVTLILVKKLLFFEFQYNFDWYHISALILVPVVFIGGLLMRRFSLAWPVVSYRKTYAAAFILLEILIAFYFAQINMSPFIYSRF